MASLKDMRELALLSQSELAKLCHVQKQAVWHWENGVSRPSAEHQRRLVEIFNCTPRELLAALKETKEQYEKKRKGEESERAA
jgi:transcriptional regulator with XRE-family HTH domain